MALIHRATLVPNKGDLVAAWLPGRAWAPAAPISSGVSYRLDDPAGEFGMEGFLLTTSDGVTLHVPLTYRGQPLAGADEHLLGVMEHSVLGRRWVYDGCADPVLIATLATTIATGGTEAEEWVADGDDHSRRDPQVRLQGSGDAGSGWAPVEVTGLQEDADLTVVHGEFGVLVVVRRVGATPTCSRTLTASWDAAADVLLAGLR